MDGEGSIYVEGGKLILNGEPLALPCTVRDACEIEDVCVVLFEPRQCSLGNRNVIALHVTGKTVWTIEPPPHGTQANKPYVGISVVKGELFAVNWLGIEYWVDIKTGAIQVERFLK